MKFLSRKNKNEGFTLIESMVSVAIFSIIMVIGVSALLSVSSANKKSRNLRTVIDSFNYVVEDMSRNFKLGSSYHCYNPNYPGYDSPQITSLNSQVYDFLAIPQDCEINPGLPHLGSLAVSVEPMSALASQYADPDYPNSGSANADNQIVYLFEGDADFPGFCQIKKSSDGGISFSNMIAPPADTTIRISCSASGFNVYDTQPSGGYGAAPRIIIRISGEIEYKGESTPFNIQTSASQRNISIVSP